jgi:hypothetical protein
MNLIKLQIKNLKLIKEKNQMLIICDIINYEVEWYYVYQQDYYEYINYHTDVFININKKK